MFREVQKSLLLAQRHVVQGGQPCSRDVFDAVVRRVRCCSGDILLRTMCLGRVILDLRCRKLLSGRKDGASKSIFHHLAYLKGARLPLLYCDCDVLVFREARWSVSARRRVVGRRVIASLSSLWHSETAELFLHEFPAEKRVVLPSEAALQWNMKLSKSSSIALLRWR